MLTFFIRYIFLKKIAKSSVFLKVVVVRVGHWVVLLLCRSGLLNNVRTLFLMFACFGHFVLLRHSRMQCLHIRVVLVPAIILFAASTI